MPELTKTYRKTQLSVTNFLYYNDEYLFLKRNENAAINAGEINAVGGKVESGEDYISAAIRETEEETGYKVQATDITFCGIIHFEGGYSKDWVTAFFKIQVPHKHIPAGMKINEGELLWIHKDKIFNSGYKLVDDINYIFEDIQDNKNIFFMNVEVGGEELKIIRQKTQKLKQK
jgi:8-oxo-dGTP pyrophosphatase MutT (NUDIX family)